ncbi:hypothetical protein ACIQHZ_31315 [Streptomyces halstedii]|uniref:hypothetical protein n=1 Tax=Streptomyces halstedii TaxID=1944 RepID=UPI0037F246FB
MTKYLDVDGYVWEQVGPLSLRAVMHPDGTPLEEESLPGYIVDADYGPLTLLEEESK